MPVINSYTHFGGHHGATAAARNMLIAAGVVAPHSGQPFTEEFLLGLGGGIGAGYFSFQYGSTSTLYIGTRGLWHNWSADFIGNIVKRVGGKIEVKESTGAKSAAANLNGPLDEARPVALWVDMGALPYRGQVQYTYTPHVIVACGRDGDSFIIDDRAPKPWRIGAEELAHARSLVKQLKMRSVTIVPPKKIPDLRKSVSQGIADCLADLANPRMKNFGLTALEKWGELVNNRRDAKGWPKAFPPGANLYTALYYTYFWIEASGTGGGGFRTMYSKFLEEGAAIMEEPRLAEIAGEYRVLGELWTALAEMALPKKFPLLKQARELITKKRDLIEKKGASAMKQIAAVTEQQAGLTEQAKSDPIMSADEALALFDAMHEKIMEIHEREVSAATRLKDVTR